MAINRISGNILQDDLRRGANLAIQGNLIYFDVSNDRVGILTSAPQEDFDVDGNLRVGNVTIFEAGNIDAGNVWINDLQDPVANTDAATKRYVDNASSNVNVTISDGSNTQQVFNGSTITFSSVANETTVVVSNPDTVTIGLPADVVISNSLSVPGNITAGNVISNAAVVTQTVLAAANITGNNVTANNDVTTVTVTASGNITGNNVISNNNVTTVTVSASGNITGNNVTSNNAVTTISVAATGNVTGNNLISNNDVTTASVTASGNVSGNNLSSNNAVTTVTVVATGNVTGDNLISNNDVTTATVTASGNVSGNNLVSNNDVATATVSATGNITGNNVTSNNSVSSVTVSASGNITGNNVISNNDITTVTVTASGNVLGVTLLGNIEGSYGDFTGNVTAANFIGNIQGNIDAGGANTQVQFNDGDILAGSAGFTFDKTSNLTTINGNIVAGNVSVSGQLIATSNISGNNIGASNLTSTQTLEVYSTTNSRTDLLNPRAGALQVEGGASINARLTARQLSVWDGAMVTNPNYVTFYNYNSATGRPNEYYGLKMIRDYTNNASAPDGSKLGEVAFAWENTGGETIGSSIKAKRDTSTSLGYSFWIELGGNITATFDGNLGLTVIGNVTGGNYTTAGQITATGNVTGGNLNTGGQAAILGNVTGNNITANNNIAAVTVTAAGNIALAGTVIGNRILGNSDLVISSQGNQNITLDPGLGLVDIDTTSGLVIPVGNTAQRPGSAVTGTIRYNTEIQRVELYDGAEWDEVLSDVSGQIITPSGNTAVFTLDRATTNVAALVAINGVVQLPGVAYTVSGNIITFAETPLTTDIIDIRFL